MYSTMVEVCTIYGQLPVPYLPRVVRLLAFGSCPQPVPPETITSIKLALAGDRVYVPHRYFHKGKWVRVLKGPLTGLIGIIRESKVNRRKIVIEVELFKQAVAVELEDEAVEPWQ